MQGIMSLPLIAERFAQLNQIIAELSNGRSITTVAVSKYTDINHIAAAFEAGFRHFGESRLQDVLTKQEAFSPPELHWHFIGTLQSNKLGKSVERFSLIQSVDSMAHAQRLSEVNAAHHLRQACLLQINPGSNTSRNGLTPAQAHEEIETLMALPGLSFEGLMAMAPPEQSLENDDSALEKTFESVRLLRDELANRSGNPLSTLSMGMSGDFKSALKQGATMIRIGQAIFGSEISIKRVV